MSADFDTKRPTAAEAATAAWAEATLAKRAAEAKTKLNGGGHQKYDSKDECDETPFADLNGAHFDPGAAHSEKQTWPGGNHKDDEGTKQKTRGIPLKTGRDFPLQKVEWIWQGWLPRGKFVILAGMKGAGKSTITFDLMARITRGGTWPDGTPCPQGDVIIWSGEDNIQDTILPRFVAAGGDLDHIYPVRDIVLPNGKTRAFDASLDMDDLIDLAKKIPNPVMLVIDPIVMIMPAKADSHKNTETRRGLQPVVAFAESRNVVIIGITHFTKGTGDSDPIERVTGSLAFGALPRVVLGASADEDNFQRRLVRIASNIGPTGGGVEYTLHEEPLLEYDGFAAQRVSWGNKLTGTPKELLNTKKKSAQADAVAFLREFLCSGSKPQAEVKAAAEAYGHSWGTVRLAQKDLKIKPKQIGRAWHWELPGGWGDRLGGRGGR